MTTPQAQGVRPTLSAARYFYITRIEHPNEIVYGENLRDYFSGIGVETREIVMHPDGFKRRELAQCLNGDAIAVLGYNWHLDHSCIGRRPFLDVARAAGVPVIQWFVDHPSSLWPDFARTSANNSRFLFQSPYAEAYFRRFVMPRCESASVVGNTGTSRHSRSDELTREAFLARDIPCLLPLNLSRIGGTLDDLEQQLGALPERLQRAVTAAIEGTQNDIVHPIEVHFFDNVPPRQLLRSPRTLHQCIRIIEEIVQIRRRRAVFSAARAFPVLIQSDAAPNNGGEPMAARFERGVGMKETLTRMRRARAVVSLSHVNDEIHPRTLNALNAGAVPIMEDNTVHRRFFSHGKNALLFRYGDDSLRECLDLVCSQPDRAYDIAQAGLALRDDPRLRFGGYHQLMALAEAPRPSLREQARRWIGW